MAPPAHIYLVAHTWLIEQVGIGIKHVLISTENKASFVRCGNCMGISSLAFAVLVRGTPLSRCACTSHYSSCK